MKNISNALKLEKNRLNSDAAWVLLLEINFPGESPMYLANNNEDIVFNGNTYISFAFDLAPVNYEQTGKIPSLNLSVSNITQGIQYYVEKYKGGTGSEVTLTVVNTSLLNESYAELELSFIIMGASITSEVITFILGTPSPFRLRFPLDRYIKGSCNWSYKSIECGATATQLTCPRDLTGCQVRNNAPRFGGFAGLDRKGIRLV